MIIHTITDAFLPKDSYQRNDRYWPIPKQKPCLLGAAT